MNAGTPTYCSKCMRFVPCEHFPPVLTDADGRLLNARGERSVFDGLIVPAAKTKSDGWSTGYYELPPDAREIQDLIEHRNMNFAVANIFKACYRLGQKEGIDSLYDLNKILWFANREVARLTKIQPPTGEQTK